MQIETLKTDAEKIKHQAATAAERMARAMKERVARVGDAVEDVADVLLPPAPTEAADRVEAAPILQGPDGTPPALPELFGATERRSGGEHAEDHFLIAELSRSMSIHQTSLLSGARRPVASRPQGWLMMVSDGFGHPPADEMASEVVIETMVDFAYSLMPWSYLEAGSSAPRLADQFTEALERTQQNIQRAARIRDIEGPPVATLTAAYVTWPNLYVAHVGDSRCYVHRDGALHRVTRDHALSTRAPDGSESTNMPTRRKLLTHALGGSGDDLRVELDVVELKENDRVFLCTDGITSTLNDQEIQAHLGMLDSGTTEEPGACIQTLLTTARGRDATEDLTAVVACF